MQSSTAAAPPRPLYAYYDHSGPSSHPHHRHHEDDADVEDDSDDDDDDDDDELERRFQDSIAYALTIEEVNNTSANTSEMGAAGTLQIWPKLHMEPYQQMPDLDKARFNLLPSDSGDPFLSVPARRHPTLHAAVSQPNLKSSSSSSPQPPSKYTIKTDAAVPPAIPQAHQRSHRVDFSRLFSRNKSKPKDKHQKPLPAIDLLTVDLPPPPPVPSTAPSRVGSDFSSIRPASAGTASQRTPATSYDRNATDNAKINVRRPPQGSKHWFDALDSSDDDLPEVVPVPHPTFNPALGPGRSRVVPTSTVSPACEGTSADYFRYQAAHQPSHLPNLQERSMLNLSSDDDDDDDDDDVYDPPAIPRWHGDGDALSHSAAWSKLAATRQSTLSVMTSGSIPIMNADSLDLAYRTPLPPLPAQYSDAAAVPPPLRQQKSYHFSSPGRTRALSTVSTMHSSTSSASTAAHSHVMTVTPEEMALLEMMRRKRAEMQAQPLQSAPRHDAPTQSLGPVAESPASSYMSRGSTTTSIGLMLDAPEGTAFPAPPSSRITHDELDMNYFGIDDKPTNRATPHSSVLAELEAPNQQLQAICFETPRKPSSTQTKLLPLENSADPYSLAPGLELSSLELSAIDLLPLPARTYSPSLDGTCSSAMTPEFRNSRNTGFPVVRSESGSSDAGRYRNSVKTIDSVDMDVLTAWGRLGGI